MLTKSHWVGSWLAEHGVFRALAMAGLLVFLFYPPPALLMLFSYS